MSCSHSCCNIITRLTYPQSANCDGQYSPLRQDLHFPSCYDPSKDLTDYKNNMVYPTTVYDGYIAKQNCPAGFKHVPHLFYEMYWNTIDFKDRWTPNEGTQPFVLANGDLSGCSGHGDFLAAWNDTVLQNIIDTCNAGDIGMDKCPGVTVRDQSTSCKVNSPLKEVVSGTMTALPGNNPLVGWGMSEGGSGSGNAASSSTQTEGAATKSSSPEETSTTAAAAQPTTPSAEATLLSSSTTTTSHAVATASPTTLADGRVIMTTVVNWVTVTKWVTEAVPTATQTVQARKKAIAHAHAHNHAHLFRHRSGHPRKW